MKWKSAWNDWKYLAASLIVCGGALWLRASAWKAGNEANAISYLGCIFLRLPLLLLAWWIASHAFRAVVRKRDPAEKPQATVIDVIGLALCMIGCLGCFPAWPLIPLILSAFLLLGLLAFRRRADHASEDRSLRMACVRVGAVMLLFTLAWYLSASTSRLVFQGLGERIETKGGSDNLTAWAAKVIAVHQKRKQDLPISVASTVGLMAAPLGYSPLLGTSVLVAERVGESSSQIPRDEIPDWVDDLLGSNQGVRGAMVHFEYASELNDPYVVLYTGGSAFHFRISVYPSQVNGERRTWWYGPDTSNWRPGIYLATEGK